MSPPKPPPYNQDDPIARADKWRAETAERIGVMEMQHIQLRKAVEENTLICAATKIIADDTKKVADETKKNTDDIVDFFKGMRVIGVLSKWITTIAAAVAAIYLIARGSK